jgi:transcriptional regulator with PAS, ATPase and Fis domain
MSSFVSGADEREHIVRVFNKHKGNQVEVAKGLGMGLSSLYRKICDLKD